MNDKTLDRTLEISACIKEADSVIYLCTDLRPLEDATAFNEADYETVIALQAQLAEATKQVDDYLKLRGEAE